MSHATGMKYLKNGVLPHMWCPGCGVGVMLGTWLMVGESVGEGVWVACAGRIC